MASILIASLYDYREMALRLKEILERRDHKVEMAHKSGTTTNIEVVLILGYRTCRATLARDLIEQFNGRATIILLHGKSKFVGTHIKNLRGKYTLNAIPDLLDKVALEH